MDAILFMKYHSERIPQKNIKDFCGKPLFYWILNSLLQVNEIDNIYIDVDSPELSKLISELFYDKRIILLDRPEHLKGDLVTANCLIGGILNRIKGEHFLQTHVTNPLLKPETIKAAIQHYHGVKKNGYDSLMAVIKHQSLFYDFTADPINHDPHTVGRTQDLMPVFEDCSNIYIFDKRCFELWGRVGLNPYMFEMSKLEAIDIDEPEDWVIAEAMKRRLDNDK